MSKKLKDILSTLQIFQDNVISQLTNMFNGAEWLNDTTSYTKQETIYKLLMLKYGDRYIRYDDESIFLNRLIFDLADFLPDIYAKQQVFIKNKLNEFLSDNRNRAVIIDNTSSNSRNTDNNSKFANSSTPLNLVISNANEITNAPISSLNLSNVKFLENYNGSNQQVNYNFVNDLIKTLNSDYSLRLNEFMELLGKHFISVVGSYYRDENNNIQTVKDEPYRFNNGYLVNEVDYLCTDNKQEINRFNEKLERLNDQVATKQNQLTAGSNISINNNVISANIPQTDLSNYYNKQQIDIKQQEQDRNIVNNTMVIAQVNQEVATNTNNINRLDNEVVKLTGDQEINGIKTFNNQILANEGLKTAVRKEVMAGGLVVGYGNVDGYIYPEDGYVKKLYFGKNNNTKFNLDLSNNSKITNVPTPTEDKDVVNKIYTDGDQTITGTKTFTKQGEVIKVKPASGGSYITGYVGNDKKWALGNTGSNDNLLLEAISGDINLKTGANGNIQCYNSLVRQVADPTNDTDATNKRYVINYINYKTQDVVINVNTQQQINPSSGYQVIDVKVSRKRQSDGYYFIEYNTLLNYQLFIHPNGKYTVYNSGNVNGFTNDFRLIITEKKV